MGARSKSLRILLFATLVQAIKTEQIRIGFTHYNDILGQYQSFKENNGEIQPCDKITDVGCSAGVARLMGHVKSIKENDFAAIHESSKFLVTPGNIISGENGWLSLLSGTYGWDDPYEEMGETLQSRWTGYFYDTNYFRPNITSLGLKEFEGGLSNLLTFLKAAEIRPIVSNINCRAPYTTDEEREFCTLVDDHLKVTISSGYRIGFVGYVNPLVVHLSEPGKLEFMEIVSAISQVVERELSDVDVVIAIGSGSVDTAKKILDGVPKLKLILLGDTPNNVEGDYPLQYGEKFIASAAKYGKSIGKLELEVETTTGSVGLISTNSRVVQNNDAVQYDTDGDSKIESMSSTTKSVGAKNVILLKKNLDDSQHCRNKECTLGRLIADAMVHCAFKNVTSAPSELIGLWHSGGFSARDYTESSILQISNTRKFLPYQSSAVLVTLNGTILKTMFESSATGIPEYPRPDWGQFLHVSRGVEVQYQLNGQTGTYLVKSLKVLQKDPVTGGFVIKDVEDSVNYHAVIPSFLYNGRSAFYFLPGTFGKVGNIDKIDIGKDYQCLDGYLQALGVLGYSAEHDRIIIESDESDDGSTTSAPIITSPPSTSTSTTAPPTSVDDITTTIGDIHTQTEASTTTATNPENPSTTSAYPENTSEASIRSTTPDASKVKDAECGAYYYDSRTIFELSLATSGLTVIFLASISIIVTGIYLILSSRYANRKERKTSTHSADDWSQLNNDQITIISQPAKN